VGHIHRFEELVKILLELVKIIKINGQCYLSLCLVHGRHTRNIGIGKNSIHRTLELVKILLELLQIPKINGQSYLSPCLVRGMHTRNIGIG